MIVLFVAVFSERYKLLVDHNVMNNGIKQDIVNSIQIVDHVWQSSHNSTNQDR